MNGPCGFCPMFTALGLPEFFTQDALFALQERFLRQSMCPWGQTAKWQLGTTTLSHPPGPLSSGDQTCHRNPQMTDGQKPPEDRRPTPPRPSRPLPHGARSPRQAPRVLSRQPCICLPLEDGLPRTASLRAVGGGRGPARVRGFALLASRRLWMTDLEKSEGFGYAPGPCRVD